MIWIIMFHYSDHGTLDMGTADVNLNWVILALACIGGGLGNCVYVIISGYMLVDKKFTVKRIIKLWLEVWFYSVTIGFICYATGITEFSLRGVVRMLFPVVFNEYWYMSAYTILFF